MKATVFPEWNTDWLVPWYHYVVGSASLLIEASVQLFRSQFKSIMPIYTMRWPFSLVLLNEI